MYSTHHQHPPPPIPPSPTLSNPDMILPFDDNERENSTPSPPFNLPSLSHLQSFYENRTSYTNGSYNNTNNNNNHNNNLDPTRNSALRTAQGAQKKPFPRHTWMHEGHDAASRRLSDIGEEDSTSPLRYGGVGVNGRNAQGTPRQSRVLDSPLSLRGPDNSDAAEPRAHSSSSGETVSAANETSSRERTNCRAEGVPQGRASGERQRRAVPGPSNVPAGVSAPSAGNEKDGSDATVVLESEAERILENAKKRLSLMEGNLTRARSTMRSTTPSMSPSPAPSSPGLGQPVGGLYQSIHRAADRRSSALRPRQAQSGQDTSSNRHSRVYSETNLPSNQPNVETRLSRSVSAMGSSTSSSFHNDERSFHYAPTRAYLTHRSSVSAMQQHSDRPNEREPSDSPQEYEIEEEITISNMDDFNSAYPVLDPPSRSQSQLQVRDLKDQMKGLHIKISTLKVKAQEDNLRRRSLQSLRTPSPLTAATHWYANPLEQSARNSHLHPSAGYGYALESPISSQGSGHTSSSNTDSTLLVPDTISEPRRSTDEVVLPPFELTDHEDERSTAESLYEDAEEHYSGTRSPESEIDREALEEILREPLDEDLALDDTPHEEREDAFDYEHFILHSALGNYTQARLRRQSNGSETSVETTRPIRERRSIRHSRSNSANSLSTVATFATAAEGRDDIESVLYWDRKFNDEINHRYVEEDRSLPHASLDTQRPDSSTLETPRKSRIVETLSSQRPDSAATGSATPTSLASSLVSTVRAAASPYPNSANGKLGINDDDTKLLELLFKSLGDVCMQLQELTMTEGYDEKQAKLLRRRLEAARRVLDGELD
ncbi:hypothetical protein BJY04DRAFT_224658 [Aspergillus karnatakaensis]|uniref:uncharacterized protein n=1 Tax=Aspergillus karnatakaensis TaxID=1810916 RepID=UPI003CCCB562